MSSFTDSIDALRKSTKLKGNKYVRRVADHALEELGDKKAGK